MYIEHHAQTLSREMAVQNVKEFASNAAIWSDGSFQKPLTNFTFDTSGHTKRARDAWGKEWVGVFLSCL